MQKRLTAEEYIAGIISGNRIILSRAITLIESQLENDRIIAQKVLEKILPYTGKGIRIGRKRNRRRIRTRSIRIIRRR